MQKQPECCAAKRLLCVGVGVDACAFGAWFKVGLSRFKRNNRIEMLLEDQEVKPEVQNFIPAHLNGSNAHFIWKVATL